MVGTYTYSHTQHVIITHKHKHPYDMHAYITHTCMHEHTLCLSTPLLCVCLENYSDHVVLLLKGTMSQSRSQILSVSCFLPLELLQIRAIDRKQEVPHDGPMCDLLWSDPEGKSG